ncbi:peptidase C14 caspase catalytic subunit p20 [Candidatus Thiomargarita nelsonii]|uniref:Peptidase C14 caspase catalytic subunit p20 n=1 Tax=Candidatus Thiomargarita nelsonii TaxID=1003181 RepID=A0A176RVX1_9GAMM|nr:peptidase C14 caspase catalytic subunit p20 [Candidatus Thiomargarita nelsonii]
MKTITLSSNLPSVLELFEMARRDSLLVKTTKGDSFFISPTDEFETEVELLRRNHSFLTMLDKFKRETETISLEQVERDADYVGDPNIKKLRNPVNDASDMAKTLRELGFDHVTLKTDLPNGEAMEKAVHQFSLKLERGGVGLFYYAGHGVQGTDGENYLIPTQVSIPTQVEIKRRAMPAKYVLDKMEYARKNELNIIILDACRNNPLPARGREVLKSGLAEMPSPAGSILIFSTAPGSRAYDGSGRNGVFTKHFLKGMKKYAHMDIEQMLKRVRKAVEHETETEPVPQVPWQNSSLKRDFCFSPSGCTDPELEEARRQAILEKKRAKRAQAKLKARAENKAKRLAEEAEQTKRELEKARRQVKIEKERAEKARKEAERAKAKATKPSNVVDTAAVAKAKQQLEDKMKQLDQQMNVLANQIKQLKEKTRLAEEAEKRAKKAQKEAEEKRNLAEKQARDAKRQREKAEAERRRTQENTTEPPPTRFTPIPPG